MCLSGAIRASLGPRGRTGVSTKRREEERKETARKDEGREGEEKRKPAFDAFKNLPAIIHIWSVRPRDPLARRPHR